VDASPDGSPPQETPQRHRRSRIRIESTVIVALITTSGALLGLLLTTSSAPKMPTPVGFFPTRASQDGVQAVSDDPYAEGCGADQQEVAHVSLAPYGTVALYTSVACDAGWAVLTTGPASTSFYLRREDDPVLLWGTVDGESHTGLSTNAINAFHTPMVHTDGIKVQACIRDRNPDDPAVCTHFQ
jgi:hypothetical protein